MIQSIALIILSLVVFVQAYFIGRLQRRLDETNEFIGLIRQAHINILRHLNDIIQKLSKDKDNENDSEQTQD